jgi:hypothetical protein
MEATEKVNGEHRSEIFPIVLRDDEVWCMDDRGDRIEGKIDKALALLHEQIGTNRERAREMTEVKHDHHSLEREVDELKSLVHQALGSARTFKWLASVGGLTGAGSIAYQLLGG